MTSEQEPTYSQPRHGWTCFHCGETFTTPGAARDHFGFDPSRDPACRIKVGEERGLVMALRRSEAEIERLRAVIRSASSDLSEAGEPYTADMLLAVPRTLREILAK